MMSKPKHAPLRGDLTFGLTTTAIIAVIGGLLWGDFVRGSAASVMLASVIALAGTAQVAILRRGRRRALSATSVRAASVSAAAECMLTFDAVGTVVEWNEAACRTFGYTREEAVGQPLHELVIPTERWPHYRNTLAQLAHGGPSEALDRRVELTLRRANGDRFPAERAMSRVQENPSLYTSYLRDISERRGNEQDNERLAAIVRSSEDAIDSNDLNGIVTAWNTGAEKLYGYTAAEAVGRQLSELIVPRGLEQEYSDITSNVLAGNPVAYETQRRCKDGELVDISLRAFRICDPSGRIVGTSTSAHDITARRHRERQADDDDSARLWRQRIEHALEAGRLVFLGQPIVEIATGAVHHRELLMRMELGGKLISPDRFLPHAERCELIGRLDRWAVETGIEYAKSSPVAINLSAKSLGNRELSQAIAEAFASSQADPSDVTFEITETAASNNIDGAREFVDAMRKLGCDVSVDDFGTGFGPFTYLRQLAVSELKIDVDFVRGMATSVADQRIVSSMVSVAKCFGMKTVAEGVEDETTMTMLRSLGVDFAQGYHFARPSQMPALPYQHLVPGPPALSH
jgi:PAS domain S-box-containing protein